MSLIQSSFSCILIAIFNTFLLHMMDVSVFQLNSDILLVFFWKALLFNSLFSTGSVKMYLYLDAYFFPKLTVPASCDFILFDRLSSYIFLLIILSERVVVLVY